MSDDEDEAKHPSSDLAGYWFSVQRGRMYYGVIPRRTHADPLLGKKRCETFSESSAKRLSRYLRNSVAVYRIFATLTYALKKDYLVGDRDVSGIQRRALCKRYRRLCGDDPKWSCCWFREYQERGVLHWHFYGTHYYHYQKLAEDWYEIVQSKVPEHLEAGTSVQEIECREQAMAYSRKYATKMEQKQRPYGHPGGRYWGVEGLRETVEAAMKVEAPKMVAFRDERTGKLHYYKLKPIDRMSEVRKIIERWTIVNKIQRVSFSIDDWTIQCYEWEMEDDEIRVLLSNMLKIYQEEGFDL